MSQPRVVFLFDVDNTLIDNDRVIVDLKSYLIREVGAGRANQYFEIFEQLRTELGYSDYLGALQRYRIAHPHDPHLLGVSSFLVNYPFANRLYPGSLDAVEHVASFGQTVILSDGDVVFQPRKVERAGPAARWTLRARTKRPGLAIGASIWPGSEGRRRSAGSLRFARIPRILPDRIEARPAADAAYEWHIGCCVRTSSEQDPPPALGGRRLAGEWLPLPPGPAPSEANLGDSRGRAWITNRHTHPRDPGGDRAVAAKLWN